MVLGTCQNFVSCHGCFEFSVEITVQNYFPKVHLMVSLGERFLDFFQSDCSEVGKVSYHQLEAG